MPARVDGVGLSEGVTFEQRSEDREGERMWPKEFSRQKKWLQEGEK